MKTMKKLLPILLCVLLVAGFAFTAYAADGATNVVLNVDVTEAQPGDIITVTLSNTEMNVTSFTAGFKFDTEKLECISIVGPDAEWPEEFYLTRRRGMMFATAVSTVDQANANGQVGFAYAGTSEYTYFEGLLFTVQFKVKDGATGTLSFTSYEDTAGTDGFKSDSIETKNVTIASSTPACQHTNTKVVPNNDGTHNVVCADETCGAVVDENVACSGGTATCTVKAVCSACNVAYGDFGAHTSAEVTYTNNGDTHSATYNCCGGAYVTNESHTYVDHICVCGAKFTGWEGKAYYIEAVMQTGWTQVGDAWYYFNTTTGEYVTGLTRVPYPTAPINGITYAPDAEALAYCEANNTTFVDATEAWFYFEDNGVFVYDTNGYISRGDNHGKLSNGMLAWHPGLIQVAEGVYCYYIGDMVNGGNIGANGDTYITKNNGNTAFAIGDIYNFENGELADLNGIVEGKYYENSRLMIGNGLTKLGENFIYVRSNGEVVMNRNYWVSENELGIAAGEYFFDENGFLVMPEEGFTGIQNIGGVLYYYEDGHKAYGAGLIELEDGSVVYVRSNGALAVGDYYVTNLSNYDGTDIQVGDKVTFGEDGKKVADKNGIVVGVYYVDNHVAYAAGLIEYNNGYIYVRSNGQVATGKYWITNVNETGFVEGYYEFDENGMMIAE